MYCRYCNHGYDCNQHESKHEFLKKGESRLAYKRYDPEEERRKWEEDIRQQKLRQYYKAKRAMR